MSKDCDFTRRDFLNMAALSAGSALMCSSSSGRPLSSADTSYIVQLEKRELRADKKFVLFPINNKARSRRVRLMKNGRLLRSFTASLGLPAQWWAHLDISAWHDQTLMLSLENDNSPNAIKGRGTSESGNAELIAAVYTSAEIWSPESVYKEPLRPEFHFTPRRGWNNDPNGLMYYAGQYHLFFQHNPYGVRWGNMHWGHAVSTDLVHWKELPIALYPRGEEDFPFSGSGIVDHENCSGWGKNGRPPMVLAFTSTGRGECMAYSQDDGVTWKEFEGNPVIKHSGRDPRLFWYAQIKQWIIAVYSERPGRDDSVPECYGISFYSSEDLKSWQKHSWIEGYYECPDLFALPTDGDSNRIRWVLTCASGYYQIGEFDGSRFTPESPRLPGPAGGKTELGPAAYAAQTFSNHPDGHRVQIAWGLVDTADLPFSQLITFPTVLSLRTTPEGVRLCREPVDAIQSLRTHTYDIHAGPLTTSPLLSDLKSEAWDIESVIRVGGVAFQILVRIGDDDYVYQPVSQMLTGPKGAMSIPLNDGRLKLRILVDRTTVTIFGDRGQAYGIFIRGNPGGLASLELRTMWGEVYIEKLILHSLCSAWDGS